MRTPYDSQDRVAGLEGVGIVRGHVVSYRRDGAHLDRLGLPVGGPRALERCAIAGCVRHVCGLRNRLRAPAGRLWAWHAGDVPGGLVVLAALRESHSAPHSDRAVVS